ncbi:unnamed protein product, partial [Darwinula stevensoni]
MRMLESQYHVIMALQHPVGTALRMLPEKAQSDDEDTGPDVAVTVDAGRDGFMDEFFAQ